LFVGFVVAAASGAVMVAAVVFRPPFFTSLCETSEAFFTANEVK